MDARPRTGQPRWLLLIHQIPPKPAYFRAKVARRLFRLGAVPIKNAVYVLPSNDQTREDFQWIAREIATEGGDATVCAASLVDGLSDAQVEALFQTAREKDYAEIAADARVLARGPIARLKDDRRRAELEADIVRRKKRIAEVIGVDFFGAPGREAAEASVLALEERLRASAPSPVLAERPAAKPKLADYRGRTWVTRKNVHVDRIGSAWLVRRFIDPKARFKLVPGQGYVAKKSEVTFDMFDAEFTHVGDRCTFETLIERFDLREPGLAVVAEIIHDIDVKDAKFGRSEAAGVAALVAGIAVAHPEDDERIALGGRMFDALLELYKRRRS
ncbi:MAG: ChrB protein [Labilithrix sp.]|nr:ChrB protein [Labilithrix sp.]